MILDLHNHTRYSPDSRVAPSDLVATARRIGLGGIAITDHNSVGGIREAEEAAGRDFLVIPAVEVSTASGHVLAYGVREALPRDRSVAETVEAITALGGIAVAAHPYRFWSGLGETAIEGVPFLAYETCNGRTLRGGNIRARTLARSRKVGETGGSDSHFLDEIAKAVTAIDAGAIRVDDALQHLAQRKTRAQGVDRDAAATMRYVTKCVGQWMMRGMRRI
ncbi:MAG TPA: PHP domain-containing protein [Thermoplasmata archaeon]|nr:PHP domain-containing protein [Thermoplasmata archaeon]